MASLFLDYHSYLFNGEEEVRKVFDELKSKRYDEIKKIIKVNWIFIQNF